MPRYANVPPPFKKPKGKVVKLEFTEEQKQKIKAILEGHKRVIEGEMYSLVQENIRLQVLGRLQYCWKHVPVL